MSFTLVREVGIEYAATPDEPLTAELRWPVVAERAADGSRLLVDEWATEKGVPARIECRTLRVSPEGSILWDSRAQGFDDGYGCLLEGGRFALLRRTTWELLVLAFDGGVEARIGLARFSKRRPRLLCATRAGNLVVTFLDEIDEVDLAEVDPTGRLLWYLPSRRLRCGVAGGVQALPGGGVLVADEFRHVVFELARDGSVAWQFGARDDPGSRRTTLLNPKAARQAPDGSRLIADTRNHRILSVDRRDTVTEISPPHDVGWCSPTFAEVLADGNRLICDAGNQRVIELDRRGQIVWEFGRSVARKRVLSFPRSVEAGADGRYLVCDTYHDRVVELAADGSERWSFGGDGSLFWPRCARRAPHGCLIADGRHGRVLAVSPEGTVLHELRAPVGRPDLAFEDPHDIRMLPGDRLLVTEAPRGLVLAIDWTGRLDWVLGEDGDLGLKDPHSAQLLPNGEVLIADTGHDRLIWADPRGGSWRAMEDLRRGGARLRLHRPRYAEISPDGALLVVDTGNNRVLAAEPSGEVLWELAELPFSPLPLLDQPRWAQLLDRHQVVVSDHSHHRIVHVRHDRT